MCIRDSGIAEDGWLPKFFTKKFNVVVTLAIISILPIIGGFSLDNIVSMMLVPGMAIGAITNFQAMSMPERFPEEWANSGLKCSPTLYRILMVISIITSLMTSFFSLTSLTLPMAIGTVIADVYKRQGLYRHFADASWQNNSSERASVFPGEGRENWCAK